MKPIVMLVCLLLPFAQAFDAAAAAEPQQLVKDTTDRVLARVRQNSAELRADRSKLYGLVNELVVPHFDFESMSRLVLAKYWREADANQQARFVEQFRILLVRTYATALLEYSGQEIRYRTGAAEPGQKRVTVRSEITQQSGVPLSINYRLRNDGASWKVIDVAVDGVSLLATYRVSFGTEVRSHGIDALIAKLEMKNQGIAE